jgi:O-antigen biosynthesis protein
MKTNLKTLFLNNTLTITRFFIIVAIKHPMRLLKLPFKAFRLWRTAGLQQVLKKINQRYYLNITKEYSNWTNLYDTLADKDRETIKNRVKDLKYKPTISVVMPVYNVEEIWLRKAIESIRNQLYPYWELCIADDCSSKAHIRVVLSEYASKDSRIKVTFRDRNGHISEASNTALELASGEFVALFDNDDELPEHALYMVAEELNMHPEADLIYSDEDLINQKGLRYAHIFKSDWNPDLFYSMNLISHLGVYRTSIIKKIGGFRKGYEGSQDYDLALRVIEQIPENHIRHIPHVLYHWRAIPGSAALGLNEKSYAHEAARRAIQSHFDRLGIEATVSAGYQEFHRAIYKLPNPAPHVSLIVVIKKSIESIEKITQNLLSETDYAQMELIIINSFSKFDNANINPNVKVIQYNKDFNFSDMANLGIKQSRGAIIGIIDSDLQPLSPHWLKEMVSHAVRPSIGVVGAKVYSSDGSVAHAGVILGINNGVGYPHRKLSKTSPGYVARAQVVQNFSCVGGGCLLLRRKVFDEVGGFDESRFSNNFGDVDLCLRIRELGYRILWTPYAELQSNIDSSKTNNLESNISFQTNKELDYLKHRWGQLFNKDPYYNPNLTHEDEYFSLAFPPGSAPYWKRFETRDPDEK